MNALKIKLDNNRQIASSKQGHCYYQPIVLTDVINDLLIASNEIFGPVAPIISFKTEQEAIDIANDTEYGLAAYFYASEGSKYGLDDYLEIKYLCKGGI